MKKIEPVHAILAIFGTLSVSLPALVFTIVFIQTPLVLLFVVIIASSPFIITKLWNTFIATKDEYYD